MVMVLADGRAGAAGPGVVPEVLGELWVAEDVVPFEHETATTDKAIAKSKPFPRMRVIDPPVLSGVGATTAVIRPVSWAGLRLRGNAPRSVASSKSKEE